MKKQPFSSATLSKTNKNSFRGFLSKLRISPGTAWTDLFGLALQRWSRKSIKRPIRTLSLFSGGGGLDIGFHDVGFSIQNMVEIDQRAIETLQANSGSGKYISEGKPVRKDIYKYRPPKDFKVDFIIGGPPCQPFSAAARRAAGVNGTTDKRGILFKEYVRIVKKLSPKGFLIENVYGLISAESGDAWARIRAAFTKAGYNVFFRILDAADYGVPQHRKRIFIVGTKKRGYRFPRPLFGPDSPDRTPYTTTQEAIEGVVLTQAEKHARIDGKYGALLDGIPPGLNYSFYTEKMGHPHPIFAWRSKFFDFLYKADPKSPIRTLTAENGHYSGPFHWNNRRFSTAELKRLQTIPDNYEIVGGPESSRRQIGNSVPPQMARILALTILNQVFGVEMPFELPLFEDNQSVQSKKRKNSRDSVSRSRAKAAITWLKKSYKKRRARKRTYRAFLSDEFGWTFISRDKRALYVDFTPDQIEWHFSLSFKPRGMKPDFSIIITPDKGETWSLGIERVVLSGSEVDPKLFTGAWKAFEMEMAHREMKADLVQLCGYYTYKPAFQCTMTFEKGTVIRKEWKVVQAVISGIGVGEIISAARLSKLWNVPRRTLLHHAIFLRSLGYEVRNKNTNPQLPKNHFLIPYVFPTLNPLSVQLRKSLERIYDKKN